MPESLRRIAGMTVFRIRQSASAALALLGFAAFLIRSEDADQRVGEIGVFAIAVGIVGAVSFVVWTAVPGIARIYAIGWADRDQQCSCSSTRARPRHLDVAR
jgi:hypothetical protein